MIKDENKPKGGLFGGGNKASPDSPVGPQAQKKIDSKLVDAKPVGKQVSCLAVSLLAVPSMYTCHTCLMTGVVSSSEWVMQLQLCHVFTCTRVVH